MNKAREKSVDPTAQGFKWQGPNAVTVTIGTMTAHLSDQGQWAHASVGVGGDHKRTAFALDEYLQGFLISGHRPFARGQAHDGVLGSLNRTGQVRSAGGQANQAIGRLDSGLPVFRVQENGKWVYKVGSPTGITYDRQFDGSITSD
jgi:hypothetical protein